MTGTLTASQRLQEIQLRREEEDKEIAKLKAEAEAVDLETVKSLIKLHGFTQTKLRGVFKSKTTKSKTQSKTATKTASKTTKK